MNKVTVNISGALICLGPYKFIHISNHCYVCFLWLTYKPCFHEHSIYIRTMMNVPDKHYQIRRLVTIRWRVCNILGRSLFLILTSHYIMICCHIKLTVTRNEYTTLKRRNKAKQLIKLWKWYR